MKARFTCPITFLLSAALLAILSPFWLHGDEPKARVPAQIFKCKPGPWGNLEYYYTYLEAPEHIVDLVVAPSERTTWLLPGKSLEELRQFLVDAGAPATEVESLLDMAEQQFSHPPYRLLPSSEFLQSLSPQTRSTIYTELRKWSENRFHHAPAIIESGDVDEWFSNTGLSHQTISSIKALTYPIGRSLAFSDVSAVLAGITTDAEERALIRALTRTRSMVLRLRVDTSTDTAAIKNYWTAGFNSQDVLPLLESIVETPDLQFVDIAHLLPPTPRKYLNTFPSVALGLEGVYPDSFWTSLNFFRYEPLHDFNDLNYVAQETSNLYSKAVGENTFGDLILLRDPVSGRAKHACIYVADDIVYTKNGRSILHPFMLMKFSDLLARSAAEHPPLVDVLRRR